MTVRFVKLLLLLIAATGLLRGASNLPLQPGEEFRFNVSWAIVPGAGEIHVRAEESPDGHLKVVSTTATRRLARMLLPFNATAEYVYERQSGLLLSLHERSQTRGKHAEHIVNFDYENRRASYVVVGSIKPRMLEMPAGRPTDLITTLLDTRHWNLTPGQSRDVLVLFNDDFYELTIHALRYENVTTNLGRFRTLVLQPRMEKTPPKGMFARGSSVQVWISQGETKLPVKFEVEFKIGTGTATLEHYTPARPTAATPAGPSPAR